MWDEGDKNPDDYMLPKPLHCCYSSMQWSEGFAQNLTKLDVSSSKKLEDIISKEKATSNVTENDECLVTPFQKLEYLVLNDLPALKSIYWSPLSFPRLKEIFIKKTA
ncbi:probable disease resistance protein At4g14610 [Raphanus sativus]|uniref:Probable disease resistance protein At4g14610 n=1 Tax=Raphanus sativus TaxID=3726 RepID=A0A9W3BXG5_RAPSA|nr:probable disease resistance protein At4g14610 [Raphanus sativus]